MSQQCHFGISQLAINSHKSYTNNYARFYVREPIFN